MTAEVGMAMEMKQLIMTVLVIVSVCTLTHFTAADPETTTVWSSCESREYRNGSAFQLTLNKVLESLVRNVNPSGFNTSSAVVGGVNSNSTVYGFVQCRGDLDSSDCKQCASTAKAKLVQGCYNTSGFIQLNGCFLRYDNRSFYTDIESTQSTRVNVLCNSWNSSQPQQLTKYLTALLLNTTAKAADSPKFFAADLAVAPSNSMENIYSLAQCWRYLSQTGCGSCLTFAMEKIFSCQSGALGAQFGSRNCYLRYEVYKFFNASVLSPPPGKSPPSSSEGKTAGMLRITLSVVAVTLVLIAAIGFWKWNFSARLKRREEIYRTGGDEGDSILTLSIANREFQSREQTWRRKFWICL